MSGSRLQAKENARESSAASLTPDSCHPHPSFILASASPRRLQLLASLGMTPAKVVPADIDETPRPNELPLAYGLRVAREKAEAVAKTHGGETILSADTVVAMGRRILPKAEDEATARRCLQLLSGRRHRVHSCVCVLHGNGLLRSKTVTTAVKFAHLTQAQMDDYIASGEWHGKAGGYAIQGRAAAFIPFISGSYSNVVGLPLHVIADLLR